MSEIKKVVDALAENFSEVEADIDPQLYQKLGPQINMLQQQIGTAFKDVDRLKDIQEFVNILLTNPRVSVSRSSLSELKEFLADGGANHISNNGWIFNLRIAAGERVVVPEPEVQPVQATQARQRITIAHYMDLERRYPRALVSEMFITAPAGTRGMVSLEAAVMALNARLNDVQGIAGGDPQIAAARGLRMGDVRRAFQVNPPVLRGDVDE